MTDYTPPAALPQHVLQRPDMQAAIARHDFGTVFTLARKWAGISFNKIAESCNLKSERVCKAARGEAHFTTMRKIGEIADGLRIPGHLLGLTPRSWENIRRGGNPAQSSVSGAVHAIASPKFDTSAERDSAGLLSSLAGLGIPITRGGGTRLGLPPFEGMTLQESADSVVKIFLQLDDELGGDSLHLPLSRYVARMSVSVENNPSDGLSGFGQLSQMAGWLALDANRHGHATRYFTSTVYVAHEIGDAGLAASAIAYMSVQENYRGNPQRALSLAQTAVAGDGGSLTSLTRTMLNARLARAHAGVGNEAACRRALETMHDVFTGRSGEHEPLWVSYVDEVEVAAQEGACYLELGAADTAVKCLRHAISNLDAKTPYRVRDRVHYLSRLAKCHLLNDDLEEACKVATQALQLCEEIGSSRIFERIEEFHAGLEDFGNAASAVAFREEFQTVGRGVQPY